MLGDAIQGALRPSQTITWLRDTNTPEDLTAATVTGRIYSFQSEETRDATGNMVVVDGTNGIFRWDYSADDVGEAGSFEVQFTATFGDDPTPAKTLSTQWEVHLSR